MMGSMEESTSFSLQTILTLVLLIGGVLSGALIIRQEKKTPPNTNELSRVIADRSWDTLHIIILLSSLFLLYFGAGFIGQFFYEEQIPVVQLIVAVLIYLLLVIITGIISRVRKTTLADGFGMGWSGFKQIRKAPLIYLAFVPILLIFSTVWHTLLEWIFVSEVELQEVAQIISQDLTWIQICYMGVAIFAAPIYEEIIFRGVLFPYFMKRIGLTAGTIMVAVIFSIMHYHLPSFVPLALLSSVLSLAYWRTGSIWTCIGIHMIWNAMTVLSLNIAG